MLDRGMAIATESSAARERAWWLRVPLVLGDPRAVFAALRDDSTEAAEARQEPVTAIAYLTGLAVALVSARHVSLLDDDSFDTVLVAVWVIAAGGVYALFDYWVAGGAVFAGLSGFGEAGRYRHARHLAAYASVPVILSLLVVWPLRLALFGGDVFRSGGSDHGAVAVALDVADAALLAWAAGLVLLGIRVVHQWDWRRAIYAFILALTVLVAIALGLTLIS
jgi:hypothetical protein